VNLSIVLPVHNEARVLRPNVSTLLAHLAQIRALQSYEIILVCNGCTDESERIAAELVAGAVDRIQFVRLAARGLGTAIAEGVKRARHQTVMFYAVDLPFGLSVIDESIGAAGAAPRLVIGSKAHPQSRVRRRLARALFSAAISVVNRSLFGVRVRDTQGSMLFPKAIVDRFGRAMDSTGAFFQAQIVIYGTRMGVEAVEIPVVFDEDKSGRTSRFKLVGDGGRYLFECVRERIKLTRGMATIV
jgi:glycosyltransferase involved in cell wall biosynthesis